MVYNITQRKISDRISKIRVSQRRYRRQYLIENNFRAKRLLWEKWITCDIKISNLFHELELLGVNRYHAERQRYNYTVVRSGWEWG